MESNIPFEETQTQEGVAWDAPFNAGLPESVASQRAKKAHEGWKDGSPGEDVIRSALDRGDEDHVRSQYASQQTQIKSEKKAEKLLKMAQTGADPQELLRTAKEDTFVAPSTVFEGNYATTIADALLKARAGDTPLGDLVSKDPKFVDDTMRVVHDNITRAEWFQTQEENLKARNYIGKDIAEVPFGTYLSAVYDAAKTFIPGYFLIEEGAILIGDKMKKEIADLYRKPLPDMQKAYLKRMEELERRNIWLAAKYAEEVRNYATSNEFIDNVTGILDAIAIGQIAKSTSNAIISGYARKLANAPTLKNRRVSPEQLERAQRAIQGMEEAKKAKDLSIALTIPEGGFPSMQPPQMLAQRGPSLRVQRGPSMLIEKGPSEPIPPLHPAHGAAVEVLRTHGRSINPSIVAESSGDLEAAAGITAVNRLKNSLMSSAATVEDVYQTSATNIPIFYPQALRAGSTGLSEELTNRVVSSLEQSGESLTKALGLGSANRLPEQAERVAVERAIGSIRREFNNHNDAILRVRHVTPEEDPTRAGYVAMDLGRPNGTLFPREGHAEAFAKRELKLKDNQYKITQHGSGYAVEVRHPISEIDDPVRATLLEGENAPPTSPWNYYLGFIRSPADTMSNLQRENRYISAHAPQEFKRLLEEATRPIASLGRNSKKNMNTFIDRQRLSAGPDGQRGYHSQTVGEFEREWLDQFGKIPTEKEVTAYFNFRQLNDFDLMINNFAMYRDKSRLGGQQFTVRWHEPTGEETAGSVRLARKETSFEGRFVDDIPPTTSGGQYNIAIFDKEGANSPKPVVINSTDLSDEALREIKTKLKDGHYRLLQVGTPNARPFGEAMDYKNPIHYVLAKDFDRAPLSWQQIPHRPGWHIDYTYQHFVKQPVFHQGQKGRWQFEGDLSAFNFSTSKQAREVAENMEHARQLLVANRVDELETFLNDLAKLPYTAREFIELFKRGHFDRNAPFLYTESGKLTTQSNKARLSQQFGDFENTATGQHNLFQEIESRYASYRDTGLLTTKNVGSESNPVYNVAPAKTLDPYMTVTRALRNGINARFMNDYKAGAVESWATRGINEGLFKVGDDPIQSNPWFHFYYPTYNEGADKLALVQFQAERANILRFLGERTITSKVIQYTKQKLVDGIYAARGQKSADIVADHLLPTTDDPAKYLRSIAFHRTMGLFNYTQFFPQAATVGQAMAISPRYGFKGATSGSVMWSLQLTEKDNIVREAARISAKLPGSMSEREFLESYKELKKTGFHLVEGEHAYVDNIHEQKLFRSGAGVVLESGKMFFKEGEKLSRYSAWNIAYMEFRAANPTAQITSRVRNRLLRRSEDLIGNMSVADQALLETGLMSVPTQFFRWSTRQMELYTGARLTPEEKLRLFSYNAIAYGIPTAVGGVTLYPWGEHIRAWALENNIEVGSNWTEFVHNGLLSLIFHHVTGREWDFSHRFGSGGNQSLRDWMRGDKTVSEIFLGASGTAISSGLKALDPFWRAVYGVFSPDDNDTFPITAEDWHEAARWIGSVNELSKPYFAYTMGKAISRRGTKMTDMTTWESIVSALLGVQTVDLSDAQLMDEVRVGKKAAQQWSRAQAIKMFQRGLELAAGGDTTQADKFMTRASVYLDLGDFDPSERSRIFGLAMDTAHLTKVEKSMLKHWKDAPWSKRQERLEQFFRGE